MPENRVVISMDSHVEFYVDTKAYLDPKWHETFDYAVRVERDRFEATREMAASAHREAQDERTEGRVPILRGAATA